ncbi:phosphotransferase [Bordetella genomosp. 12]|uniref:phosphotransferase n=1 Tax=Bordetella genomosp. 12 TaxID=463035 RepID=UPI00142D4C96|nr:phosphotransferase [Bordetella genomosp. 12]
MGSKQDFGAAQAGLQGGDTVLTTSPPAVTNDEAAQIAARYFGGVGPCDPLTGERDRNFRGSRPDGSKFTLKFINPAETVAETVMQIAVLKHLEPRSPMPVPRHLAPALAHGQDWLDWPAADGEVIRVRAYSYLEGTAGSRLRADESAWRAVGQAAGQLDLALLGFDHPAARRDFLWDSCRAPRLLPWLDVITDAQQRLAINDFLTRFESRLARYRAELPCQVIHNDLSPSNILLDPEGGTVTGVLDFGDMVHAPRIAEAAIAASYHMTDATDPLHTLACLLDGFDSVAPLSALEREQALDLVLARLTQRMVITARRALQFPSNRAYILRSQAAASQLFDRLIEPWQRHAAF